MSNFSLYKQIASSHNALAKIFDYYKKTEDKRFSITLEIKKVCDELNSELNKVSIDDTRDYYKFIIGLYNNAIKPIIIEGIEIDVPRVIDSEFEGMIKSVKKLLERIEKTRQFHQMQRANTVTGIMVKCPSFRDSVGLESASAAALMPLTPSIGRRNSSHKLLERRNYHTLNTGIDYNNK